MITKISNEVIAIFAASSSYKERFIAEYILLKQKYEKLKVFNTKIEAAGEMAFRVGADKVPMPEHDCPEELLRRQQHVMGEYLHILEVRAVIEGIDLKEATQALARESIRRASENCCGEEAKCCCQSENTPPCEAGIYENAECGVQSAESTSLPENVIDLDNTIKVFEKCKFGTQEADPCDGCILNNNGCVARLDGSVLYHLKSYAEHK